MQMQMTERDKKLIVFLVVFVILVAGGYWGIYPVVLKTISLNAQIQDARAQRDMNEIKVAQAPLIEIDNERLEADMADLKADFFPIMTSAQVDKYMTGLILDYQLYAYSLSIEMPTAEAEVKPYQYSVKAKSGEDAFNTYAQTEDSNQQHDQNEAGWNSMEEVSTGIYEVEVDMRVGGSRADMQRLIDDLSVTDRKIHLVSYRWDDERSISFQNNGTYEVNMEQTMTMTVRLYMCEE